MGIWDVINSGKETVKWYTPEPVKKACNTSYNYSAAAVTKIDNVVRVNGLQMLGQYIPDDEGLAKMVSFCTKFAKNVSVHAVREAAIDVIPGGRAIVKIYSDTVCEVENECKKKQNRPCIKEIVGNSGEVENECKKKQDRPCIKEIVGNSGENTAAAGAQILLESGELVPDHGRKKKMLSKI